MCFRYQICVRNPLVEGSAPRDVGRPSKIAPYSSLLGQWLRDTPDLSGAEILRRARLAGYRGSKSALYEFVRRLRAPGSGYKRCPRCRALLRDIAESCRHCGLSLSSTLQDSPAFGAGAVEATRQETAAERYLVIAAPDRPELYEYLKRKFGRAIAFKVVREQRVADRRVRADGPVFDRRRWDRRAKSPVDADLRAFGFAIVIRD